jgi:hypothetical protein
LLAILNNPLITLGQLWCFDLAFLKEFVTTGKIPRPKEPTRRIIYRWLIRTLDGMDKILKTLGERNVLTLQVSAGHRLTLGSLYLEVFYPWDGFYNALHTPLRIKELLSKKWPADWMPPEWARENIENQRPVLAKKITASEERAMLSKLLDEFNSRDPESDPRPIANPEQSEDLDPEKEELSNDPECLPISTVGTLYNNLSIVTKIHVLGGINPATMLFPGDLTDWTYLIARRFPDLSSDIFKYPHHGSSGPGISRKALRHFGHPFPRCCPCGPWCHPECCEWHHKYWHRLEKRIATRDACRLFTEIVKPKHVLVYPYPTQGLPKQGVFSPFMGQLHANRESADADLLADVTNQVAPHILRIGKERDEIEILSEGARS